MIGRRDFMRAARAPQRGVRRRRHRDDDPAIIALLEHFEYSTPFLRFLEHQSREPDLLVGVTIDDEAVLDVGGFIGEWCVPVAERTDVPIHVYEPSIWARDRLLAATATIEQVVVHTHGLGSHDRVVELARIGPGSTIYDDSSQWERGEVEIRDVAEVFESASWERAAMKVNIEGGEYELFDRLIETGHLGRVGTLYIQFHDWMPRAPAHRRRIRRALEATHRNVWNYPWVWEKWVPRQEPESTVSSG